MHLPSSALRVIHQVSCRFSLRYQAGAEVVEGGAEEDAIGEGILCALDQGEDLEQL